MFIRTIHRSILRFRLSCRLHFLLGLLYPTRVLSYSVLESSFTTGPRRMDMFFIQQKLCCCVMFSKGLIGSDNILLLSKLKVNLVITVRFEIVATFDWKESIRKNHLQHNCSKWFFILGKTNKQIISILK